MVLKSAVELIYHLSFFGVKKKKRRRILYRSEATSNLRAGNGRWGWLSKWRVSCRLTWTLKATVFHRLFPFVMLRRKRDWNNRRISRSIGIWIKIDWRGKRQISFWKEKDELTRDVKRLQHALKKLNFAFQNLRKRMKASNFTLAFHGMHLCFFTICCFARPRT